MPLKGSLSQRIELLIREGRPKKQAIAIAYSSMGKGRKKKKK